MHRGSLGLSKEILNRRVHITLYSGKNDNEMTAAEEDESASLRYTPRYEVNSTPPWAKAISNTYGKVCSILFYELRQS